MSKETKTTKVTEEERLIIAEKIESQIVDHAKKMATLLKQYAKETESKDYDLIVLHTNLLDSNVMNCTSIGSTIELSSLIQNYVDNHSDVQMLMAMQSFSKFIQKRTPKKKEEPEDEPTQQ